MPVMHLDRRSVAALVPQKRAVIYYDDQLKGFGLRVLPTGQRTWIVEYRPGAGGRQTAKRRMSLGAESPSLKADVARAKAKHELAKVHLGQDPAGERARARAAETVGDVLSAYLRERIKPARKARTYVLFEGYVRNHLEPLIGARRAEELTRAEVAKLHRKLGEKATVTANRAVSLLRAAFTHASKTGLLPEDHRNPASRIDPFPEQRRERYLTSAELSRLGATLRLAETDGLPWEPRPDGRIKHAPKVENRKVTFDVYAIAAIRLLLFTGARLREILHLRWEEYDEERGLLFLADSKTGRKTIVLGRPAMEILADLPRRGPFVIAALAVPAPGESPRPRSDLNRPWARITAHAGLEGLRIHDLRHSFASVGAGSGLGLPIIGKLLGHKDSATTQRYAHLDADPLRRASDAIAGAIANSLTSASPSAG